MKSFKHFLLDFLAFVNLVVIFGSLAVLVILLLYQIIYLF